MRPHAASPPLRRFFPKRLARHAALFLLVLFAACSDDPQSPPPVDTPLEPVRWTRVNGGFGPDSLYALWSSPGGRVFIACSEGMIHNENAAQEWRLESFAAPVPRIRSLWGTSAGPDRVYAVGDGGAILVRSGGAWSPMASPVSTTLHDVAGLSASSVYAAGAGPAPGSGLLLAYDGIAWTAVADAPVELFGVWAVSDSAVFVVGDDGYFARFDGTNFIPILPNHGVDLFDVWATLDGDVYACGDLGVVLRYNGTQPTLQTGSGPALRAISGSPGGTVFVAGDGGALVRWYGEGSQWLPMSTGLTDDLVGVAGYVDEQALAIGHDGSLLLHQNGAWRILFAGSSNRLRAVAYDIVVGESPSGGVAIVGAETYEFPEALFGITAFSPSNAYAVGAGGAIYHFADPDWAPETSGVGVDLTGIAGLTSRYGEPLRMYAVGRAGTVLVWKGGPWQAPALPAEAATMDFTDVWAAAIDDVFAVASNSTQVLRYDDPYELAPWTVEQTPATSPLVAIGGWRTETWAASESGELLHHNGNGWKKVGQPGSITDIRAISETAFYAVGRDGALRYYQDGKWSNFSPEYTGDFFGVWVRSGWNAVAVGTNGAIWVHRTN